ERTLEGVRLDGDGDPWQETLGSIGPIRAASFRASRATLGSRQLDPRQARIDALQPIALDPELVRLAPAPPGSPARARFDLDYKELVVPAELVESYELLEWHGHKVGGLVRFQGLPCGLPVTLVGLQRGERL